MSAVLDQVEAVTRRARIEDSAKRKKTEQAFAALVEHLADEGDASVEDVIGICAAAGRTVEELREAVSFRCHRIKASETLAGLPAAEGAVTGAKAAIEKLEADHKAALEKYTFDLKTAKRLHQKAVENLDVFTEARSYLINTGSADLKAKLSEINSGIHSRRGRVAELREEIRFATDKYERRLAFVKADAPGYDKSLQHYYTAAERATLTAQRWDWVNVEEYAAQQVEKRNYGEHLEAAKARGEVATDTWDTGRLVKQERERLRLEIVAALRAAAVEQIDKLRAEVARLEGEMRQLAEDGAAVEAELLKP